MAKLSKKRKLKKAVEEITSEAKTKKDGKDLALQLGRNARFDRVVSTGSTLLDLALSGKRVRGGGLPGGILVEIYGPEGSGKTAVLAEICASAQIRGGEAKVSDPEARLDKEYVTTYGVGMDENFDYSRPETVNEMMRDLYTWDPAEPSTERGLNVFGGDSIAALTTELEQSDEGDKRGQKQAKDISQNLRRCARRIGRDNILTVFTNQMRQGETGEVTPGGKALPYYASVRLRVGQKDIVYREKKAPSGKVLKKAIGIQSFCYVRKSTIDSPYRSCMIYIIFDYGIDDVRANLQWYKDMTGNTKYDVFNDKGYQAMEAAIKYIEENRLQRKLRNRVIDLWQEIEATFTVVRKPKVRF